MGSIVRARVSNGRLVVDEPSDLPDGTEVVLAVVDEEDEDELDDEERARLHEAIAASAAELDQGLGMPIAEVLAGLESRRS